MIEKATLQEIYKLVDKHKIFDFQVKYVSVLSYDEAEWNNDTKDPMLIGSYSVEDAKEKDVFVTDLAKLLSIPEGELNMLLYPKYNDFPFPEKFKATRLSAKTEEILKPVKDQVTLLYFWEDDGDSIDKNIGELLVKHPDWNQSVAFIGIYMGESIEKATSEFSKLNKHTAQQYWLPGGDKAEIVTYFSANLSFCILVGTDGKMALVTNPFDFNMEKSIETLLTGGKVDQFENKEALKDNTYTTANIETDLKKFTTDFQEEIKVTKDFSMFATHVEIGIKSGEIIPYQGQLEIKYRYTDKTKESSDKIKAEAIKIFDQKIITKVEDELIKMKTLKYGETCTRCHEKLGKVDQYLCICCDPAAYFYKTCIDNCEQKQFDDLVHCHPLYFIQEKSESMLENIIEGDIQINETKSDSKMHNDYTCDMCNLTITGIHWRCVNCEVVDICQKCFEEGKKASNEEIMENAKECGHDFNTHVCIREDFEGMYTMTL